MLEAYPFGQLTTTQPESQTTTLVCKSLVYSSPAERDILLKMKELMSSLQNDHLIALHHATHHHNGIFEVYYEYAPLALERWVLEVGDDLVEQLELEMVCLARYLSQAGIKFRFNPSNVGLSQEIKLKYFLADFTVDVEGHEQNFKEAEAEIRAFFTEFKNSSPDLSEEEEERVRKSADSALTLSTTPR